MLGQRQHLADRRVDVGCDIVGLAVLQERADPADHFGGAVSFLDHAFERVLRLGHLGRGPVEPAQRGVAVGDHRGERLVDLVRDRGGKLAHGGQPRDALELGLRHRDRGLGTDALGLVRRHADDLGHLALLIDHRMADGVDVLDRAVVQHRAVGHFVGCLFAQAPRDGLLDRGAVLRVDQTRETVERGCVVAGSSPKIFHSSGDQNTSPVPIFCDQNPVWLIFSASAR